jgi:hypothetical protein
MCAKPPGFWVSPDGKDCTGGVESISGLSVIFSVLLENIHKWGEGLFDWGTGKCADNETSDEMLIGCDSPEGV